MDLSETPPREHTTLLLVGNSDKWRETAYASLLVTQKHGRVTIYMDNQGGDPDVATSVVELMKIRQLKSRCIVLGSCSSAANIIFAGCEERYCLPLSVFYFHPMRMNPLKDLPSKQAPQWAKAFVGHEEMYRRMVADSLKVPFGDIERLEMEGTFLFGRDVANRGWAKLWQGDTQALPRTRKARK